MTSTMGLATISADQLLNGVASRLIYEGSACDSWPCWNEGICLPNGTKDYSCRCMEQFAGDHCQFRVSQLCTSARCTAGTICILNDLTVQCPPSSTDEFFSSCLTAPCLNGGICIKSPNRNHCQCPEPFHGSFCQFDTFEWTYDWSTVQITLVLVVVFLVACAISMICCSGNTGFYVSVPTKRYSRWEEGNISDEEEDMIALGEIEKGTLRVSRTTETILDAEPGTSRQSFHNPIVDL